MMPVAVRATEKLRSMEVIRALLDGKTPGGANLVGHAKLKLFCALVSALNLTACQEKPAIKEAPASAKENQSAYNVYYGCLLAAARVFDDGRSDPQSIATGIQSRCDAEFGNLLQTRMRGMNPYDAVTVFIPVFSQRRIEFATEAVLQVRQERHLPSKASN